MNLIEKLLLIRAVLIRTPASQVVSHSWADPKSPPTARWACAIGHTALQPEGKLLGLELSAGYLDWTLIPVYTKKTWFGLRRKTLNRWDAVGAALGISVKDAEELFSSYASSLDKKSFGTLPEENDYGWRQRFIDRIDNKIQLEELK